MKSIFEEMGGTYRWEGDYCVPNIEFPEQEEYPLGKYGRLHQSFWKSIILPDTLTSYWKDSSGIA